MMNEGLQKTSSTQSLQQLVMNLHNKHRAYSFRSINVSLGAGISNWLSLLALCVIQESSFLPKFTRIHIRLTTKQIRKFQTAEIRSLRQDKCYRKPDNKRTEDFGEKTKNYFHQYRKRTYQTKLLDDLERMCVNGHYEQKLFFRMTVLQSMPETSDEIIFNQLTEHISGLRKAYPGGHAV